MLRPLLAEYLGTFGLVFAGAGAVTVDGLTHGTITHCGVALTFGLVVLSMIYCFGDTSGAHLNPAVTVAFAAAGRFPATHVGPYTTAQMAGAVSASGFLKVLFPAAETIGETLPAGTAVQSFLLEAALTFFLMMVIFGVSTGSKQKGLIAGIAVGAAVALEAMFAGPISGASMNPARSLGPAVLSGRYAHLWIYFVAPGLGALLAVPVSRLLHPPGRAQAAASAVQKKDIL